MRRHKNLFDKLTTFENLILAGRRAAKGKRSKRAVARFIFDLEKEVIQIQEELCANTYRPSPFNIFEVREPKVRKICASTFRDRVVHHAICNLLEPIFERRFIGDSFACRRGKGTHMAMRRCQEFARSHRFFLKCDIRKFFDSIDHDILKTRLQRVIGDEKFLDLLNLIVEHSVPGNPPGVGIPIGNLTSQNFANFYLDVLDHHIKDRLALRGYVRYMDDFICFSDSKEYLHALLVDLRVFLRDELKLELKEKIVKIAPVSDGVPFLGFRIYPNLIRLQRPNLIRFRKKLKSLKRARSQNQISEDQLICSVQSLYGHVNHANTLCMRRKIDM